MTDEFTPTEGMNRREMLKRSALVGGAGALMWAAPSVTTFANPAFGQTEGTPAGKGLSYIALIYDCEDGNGNRFIKFDLNNGQVGLQTLSSTYTCTTGNTFKTPGCESQFPQPPRTSTGYNNDCAKFQVWYDQVDDSGKPVTVRIVALNGCVITGTGYGKCGNPDNPNSGGECMPGAVSGGGTTITFANCGSN